jgi:hypothetical protein
VILRDPLGDEVLRAELSAPPLAELWSHEDHRYGPVEVKVEVLRVVEGDDGTTNLERALAELPRDEEPPLDSRSGLSTDVPFEIEIELSIERLRYSSGNGKESVLEDLDFHGRLEWGPLETRFVLEGGSDSEAEGDERLYARVECERPEFGPRRPWSISLALEGVPTVLARSLCAALRPLAPLAGERLERLGWSRDGKEVRLSCADEGARFELLGEEQEGVVHGGEGGRLTATLPCAGRASRALVALVLPFLDDLECQEAGDAHALDLRGFRWPLDGDWSRLRGELELVLPPASGTLARALGPELGGTRVTLAEATPLRLRVEGGELAYAALRLPLEQGWIQVDGARGLGGGACALELSGERAGEVIASVRLTGRDAVPVPTPDPPAPPVAPGDEIPRLPGEDG